MCVARATCGALWSLVGLGESFVRSSPLNPRRTPLSPSSKQLCPGADKHVPGPAPAPRPRPPARYRSAPDSSRAHRRPVDPLLPLLVVARLGEGHAQVARLFVDVGLLGEVLSQPHMPKKPDIVVV